MKPVDTLSIFNKLASDYWLTDYLSFGWTHYMRKKSISLLNIQPNEIVCDAMCGTANNYKLLAQKNCLVIAIDNAECMINIAKTENKNNHLQLILEDFLKNNIPDKSIDKLICTFGLKSLREVDFLPFISQINRILKSNGTFVLAEFYIKKEAFFRIPILLYIKFIVPFLNYLCTHKNPHRYLYDFTAETFNLSLFCHYLSKENIEYQIHFTGLQQGIILQGKVS